MREIELSKGFKARVSDQDFSRLNKYSWFVWIPSKSPHLIYAVRKITKPDGRTTKVLMHRQILCASGSLEVDHKDRDTLNNQRGNLRFATASQNQANSRQHRDAGSSRFKGVTWHRGSGKWQASVQCQKQRFYVGYFSDENLAAEAYNKKAKELFGEYARLNNI